MPRPATRILGLDPGTVVFGWGVVEARGSRLRALGSGALRPPREAGRPARLAALQAGLRAVVARFGPRLASMEEAFVGLDPRAALRIGEARGIALAALAEASVPVLEIPPATVKKAVAGNGRASKEQVGRMVRAILGLPAAARLPEDAADALAVAIAASARAGPL